MFKETNNHCYNLNEDVYNQGKKHIMDQKLQQILKQDLKYIYPREI